MSFGGFGPVVPEAGDYNRRGLNRPRALSVLPKALFIFYCTAVGVYLLLRPWAAPSVPGLTGSGFFRGFVSGLGLLHLVAGAADLRALSRELASEPPR
ncbi:MAG TPA: hypothetical protein VFS53_00420 [Gemmatimonadota bacterium]|nr:hypothetical protein [Gemmatimonadota bacterium]